MTVVSIFPNEFTKWCFLQRILYIWRKQSINQIMFRVHPVISYRSYEANGRESSAETVIAVGANVCPHRDHSLQTNAEVLLLVKLQFLQSDSRLPDELVVSELVLVAHWESADRRCRVSLNFYTTGRISQKEEEFFFFCLPESFSRHFVVGDAVVHQSLVPHGVQSVFKRLGAKLVGLRSRNTTHVPDVPTKEKLFHFTVSTPFDQERRRVINHAGAAEAHIWCCEH